ncbi:MAG: glycosyltransferase [Bacilli bacterium]|nr:glycosyltransferase [Bacilli bacterium]
MKKISILALHLGYGGIEKCVVNLANTLCDRYNVEIAACYRLYDKSVFDLDKRVKVIYLNNDLKPNHETLRNSLKSKNPIKITKELAFSAKVLHYRKKTMVQYIRNTDSEVIISTRDIFNYWLSGYCRDGVLKIGWEHNHFHENMKYAERIANSAKNLDYLVLVSSELQKFYTNKLHNSNCMCIYIPNSIDKLPMKIAPLKEKRLVSVGRLSPEKGYLDLLKIFNKITKSNPDWKLDVIGDGKEKDRLKKYIEKNGLSDKVTLHGFQGKEYIDKILHNSSIYLMTSYTESFGIVLIEAMSHGVPCIAFDSAEGAREIINSGENGYLIKNRNFDAMIMKVQDLINNEEDRIKIGKQARNSVKKYTSDIVGEEWITLIEESDIYD